jgi:charged multivesicular body protein 3
MEEMMDDIVDVEEDEELEEEATAEVDKVLFELTDGKLGQAGSVGTELPVRVLFRIQLIVMSKPNVYKSLEDKVQDEEVEREMAKYREQLNGLLSS